MVCVLHSAFSITKWATTTIICTAMVTNVYLLYAQFEDIVSKTITKNANIFKAIVLSAQCKANGQSKAT